MTLAKLRAYGVEFRVIGGDRLQFRSRGRKLTDRQRDYIRKHKPEIIAALNAERTAIAELNAERTANAIVRQLVRCWTPAGTPIDVEARSHEHAEFLRKMNPKPGAEQ